MRRSTNNSLPPIAVEEETTAVRLALPTDLNATLNLFAEWFAEVTGRKPLSPSHVINGALTQYLEEHADFQKWRAQHTNGKTNGTTPYALAPTGRAAARE
jgi:hypothetical protein